MRTQDAHKIHIVDYLSKIGLKPIRQQNGTKGLEYVYRCPLRRDNDPSLCVNINNNIWSDRPTAQGGRLLELVCYLNNLPKDSISHALSILDAVFSGINFKNKEFTPPKQQKQIFSDSKKPIEIIEVKELFSYPLKNYLSKERAINLNIATNYIKEVRYKVKNSKVFYAIGFKSGDAFSLRSKFFKGFAGTNIDLSIYDKKTNSVNLFEGFIDFLSLLTIENKKELEFTSIIMNSSSLLKRFIEYVRKNKNIKTVYYYRDRDELNLGNTGLITLKNLKEELPEIKIIDKSAEYPNHKDLNDWLVQKSA